MPPSEASAPAPSAPPRRWRLEPAPEAAAAAALAAELGVPPVFAGLLLGRGLADAGAARRFLKPSRGDLLDPAALPDVDAAVGRLAAAVRAGETICVHGDYDADGQCAAAIAARILAMAGARVFPFVPHRLRDGYDLSQAGIAAARGAGASVILALDCGTTALEAVAQARATGLDVVVVDHHLPGPKLPDALAVVNPRRPDSAYPFPDLCAAGLTFKVMQRLAPALGLPEGAPWYLLDLVALATVADLVPLVGENRILVRLGLKLIGASRWAGLAALLTVSGLGTTRIRARHLAFVLAPRLNAAGRIGDAGEGLRLLLTDDTSEAYALAASLERQNTERQALDQRTMQEALDQLASGFDPVRDTGVVLAREGWHPGVVGIVASRVVERLGRPAILIALDGEMGRGSGRSVGGCDIHRALAGCADLLERWGGHRMAAGLTVRRERLPEFRAAFARQCAAQLGPAELAPSQRVDAVVRVRELTPELERALEWLEPTGMGNPAPVFGLDGVTLRGSPRPVGDGHVRLVVAHGGDVLPVVGFNLREQVARVTAGSAGPFRAAVRLQRDTWNGNDAVEGRLVSFEAR